jgi:uncharacterized membrane protein YccC
LHWPSIFGAAIVSIVGTYVACALAMVLTYAALPPTPETKLVLLRTCAIAACLAPLSLLLVQRSLWSPFLGAFIVWSLLQTPRTPKPYWIKFAISLAASALLQFGLATGGNGEYRIAELRPGDYTVTRALDML